jgi:glutamine amidotransferase
MKLALVDSGVANLTSVVAALRRLGVTPDVTSDAAVLARADKVILPGVGSAQAAMTQLRAKGLIEPLRALTQPVLGICLGMQILFERSEESGGVDALGVLPGTVELLPGAEGMPIPHMGWNQISPRAAHPLLRGIADGAYVYFVHSYAVPVGDVTLAACVYSRAFTAVAGQGNFMGCQFHPERSGEVGAAILKNFVEL